jgi:tetratricopeptide (TPR) repeat protein
MVSGQFESSSRYERIIDLLSHFKKGDFKFIISKSREYKQLYPEESIFLYCLLIRALYHLDYKEESFNLVNEAIYKFPGNEILYFFLGEMYERDGKKEEAEENYQKVLEITRNQVILSYTYTKLAGLKYKSGSEEESLDNIKTAIRAYPGNKTAFDLLNEIVSKNPKTPESDIVEEFLSSDKCKGCSDRKCLNKFSFEEILHISLQSGLPAIQLAGLSYNRFWNIYRRNNKKEFETKIVEWGGELSDKIYEWRGRNPAIQTIGSIEECKKIINYASIYLDRKTAAGIINHLLREFEGMGIPYKYSEEPDYDYISQCNYHNPQSYNEAYYLEPGYDNDEIIRICQGTRMSCPEIDIICYEADVHELLRLYLIDEALELLKEAEKKYPESAEIYILYGELYTVKSQQKEAGKYYNAALSKAYNSYQLKRVQLNLAFHFNSWGHNNESLRYVKNVLLKDPENEAAFRIMQLVSSEDILSKRDCEQSVYDLYVSCQFHKCHELLSVEQLTLLDLVYLQNAITTEWNNGGGAEIGEIFIKDTSNVFKRLGQLDSNIRTRIEFLVSFKGGGRKLSESSREGAEYGKLYFVPIYFLNVSYVLLLVQLSGKRWEKISDVFLSLPKLRTEEKDILGWANQLIFFICNWVYKYERTDVGEGRRAFEVIKDFASRYVEPGLAGILVKQIIKMFKKYDRIDGVLFNKESEKELFSCGRKGDNKRFN